MRSAKESGCFPYRSKLVCFMELYPDGRLEQLTNQNEKLDACYNAIKGRSKIVAVWPENWRSDLFIIDDVEEFMDALMRYRNGDSKLEFEIT